MSLNAQYHSLLTTSSGIHIPYAFIYSNSTSRESASGLSSTDIGKLARQLDNNTLWMLISISPLTWKSITGVSTSTGTVFTEDVIGTDFIKTRSGTITRNPDGSVASVQLIGGRNIVINRTEGVVTSIFDGTRTTTLSRDGDGNVTGWTIT